jgi:hypothetical protein
MAMDGPVARHIDQRFMSALGLKPTAAQLAHIAECHRRPAECLGFDILLGAQTPKAIADFVC